MTVTPSFVALSAVDQMFKGLAGVLEKAATHAKEFGVEESVYLNWRLAPDMLDARRQVQIATELPARALSRLAGVEPPSFPDGEESFEELRARISTAQSFIRDLDKAALDADHDADITFPAGPDAEMTLPRDRYLMNYILPNFYFHVTAAYAIFRTCGVPLGKMDYLASD